MQEIQSPLIEKCDKHIQVESVGVGTDQIAEKEPEVTLGGSSTGEDMVAVNDNIDRPSVKGAYRPIRNGNINGSIIALIASAIGISILNLPIRVDELGLIPYTIILSLSTALSYYGMIIMMWVINRHKVQSYAEMVTRAFGHKAMLYSQFALIFLGWGVTICNEVAFISFASQLLYDLFGVPLYENRDSQVYSFLGVIGRIVIGLILVLSNAKYLMMTDLKQMLEKAGRSSIIGVFFCSTIVFLTAFFGFTRDYHDSKLEYNSIFNMDYRHVSWFEPLNMNYFNIILQATAGVYFSMINPQFVFPLVSHLKRPTKKRVSYIFKWAHIEEFLIFILFGWIGFLLLTQHEDIIPIAQLVISSIPTWPLLVGKIMLVYALFFRLPLSLFTTKEFIFESLDIPRTTENYKKMNIWLVGSSLAIALLFQNINMYFSLIGGTFGVGTAAVIPLLCAYKLVRFSDQQRYISWFVIVMSVVIFLGAIQSFIYQN